MPNPRQPAHLYLKHTKGRPAKWIIIDGRRQISTGILADDIGGAEDALETYFKKTRKPDTSKRDLAAIKCADVMRLYYNDMPDLELGANTMATAKFHLKALNPFWGAKSLAEITGANCRKYVKERSVKTRTSRNELKTFQTAINHWHKESPLVAVPQVTLPKVTDKRERVLERKEVAAMLWACRKLKFNHVARFILIGVYTGTRHNAILALRWMPGLAGGHIDSANRVMYRRGSAERETNKRRPPVQIVPGLGSHLSRWMRQDVAISQQRVIHFKGQPITKMKRAWASVVEAAGLGPDVTPHVLRHTAATWLLREGKTIWDVAGVIGADASTVERVYAHHRKIDDQQKRLA